jgi:adenine-specific DNA-methyltransferase
VPKVFTYKSATGAAAALSKKRARPTILFHGDCLDLIERIPDNAVDLTICSPPYCIGKAYEASRSLDDFITAQHAVLPEIVRITKPGGSICWEVGYYVQHAAVYPLDYVVFDVMSDIPNIVLRNRIVWTYGHGMHAQQRFSGRHETILWFTKGGDDHTFDLDAVRVPQKYPGKTVYSGPRKGQFSGNPKGKNPSDVWSIPNVKAKHLEKLAHPCQFPVGLADRLVRALCPKNGLTFDPYMGTASTGVAAILNKRRFIGAEVASKYFKLSRQRLMEAYAGTVRHRPVDRPVFEPTDRLAVARRPAHFKEPE